MNEEPSLVEISHNETGEPKIGELEEVKKFDFNLENDF
jgi:hypothetical protein